MFFDIPPKHLTKVGENISWNIVITTTNIFSVAKMIYRIPQLKYIGQYTFFINWQIDWLWKTRFSLFCSFIANSCLICSGFVWETLRLAKETVDACVFHLFSKTVHCYTAGDLAKHTQWCRFWVNKRGRARSYIFYQWKIKDDPERNFNTKCKQLEHSLQICNSCGSRLLMTYSDFQANTLQTYMHTVTHLHTRVQAHTRIRTHIAGIHIHTHMHIGESAWMRVSYMLYIINALWNTGLFYESMYIFK